MGCWRLCSSPVSTHAYAYTNSGTNAKRYAVTNSCSHTDSCSHPNTNSHSHPNADADSDSECNTCRHRIFLHQMHQDRRETALDLALQMLLTHQLRQSIMP
jgi:hypothetical protein